MSISENPLLYLVTLLFRKQTEPKIKEPPFAHESQITDERNVNRRIDWSYSDFETQLFSSNTPPIEIYHARQKSGSVSGKHSPPILKYASSYGLRTSICLDVYRKHT
jgi:hypothetical protein